MKTELTYYKHTHRSDVITNSPLFKLIRVTHEERLNNLMILLNQQAVQISRIPKKVTLWTSFVMVINTSQTTVKLIHWNLVRLVELCGMRVRYWNGILGTSPKWKTMTSSKSSMCKHVKKHQIWSGSILRSLISRVWH